MTRFVAIKIHYDHRHALPAYLKYSKAPTAEEYQSYLDLFRNDGIGGEGFHECLNFSVYGEEPARIYLPPTCIPDDKYADEDFVFFSFTYKYDQEMPASIVGVHAGAKLKSRNRVPIVRDDVEPIAGADQLRYHAESPSYLTTLITPSIPYDFKDCIYTPAYKTWGYGLRYLSEENAQNILSAALKRARKHMPTVDGPERLVIDREISVLNSINEEYFGAPATTDNPSGPRVSGAWSIPDKELGYKGEQIVYEQEVAYALANDIPANEVQWVSQAVPQSPYDIKSIRVIGDGYQDHFIEVKSSGAGESSSINISSGQINLLKANPDCSAVKIVNFTRSGELESILELNYAQLSRKFDFVPIKFRLRPKQNGT